MPSLVFPLGFAFIPEDCEELQEFLNKSSKIFTVPFTSDGIWGMVDIIENDKAENYSERGLAYFLYWLASDGELEFSFDYIQDTYRFITQHENFLDSWRSNYWSWMRSDWVIISNFFEKYKTQILIGAAIDSANAEVCALLDFPQNTFTIEPLTIHPYEYVDDAENSQSDDSFDHNNSNNIDIPYNYDDSDENADDLDDSGDDEDADENDHLLYQQGRFSIYRKTKYSFFVNFSGLKEDLVPLQNNLKDRISAFKQRLIEKQLLPLSQDHRVIFSKIFADCVVTWKKCLIEEQLLPTTREETEIFKETTQKLAIFLVYDAIEKFDQILQ